MARLKTLDNLRELEESAFGRPYPRHGLRLLYWFATHCLYFDNNNTMCWKQNPEHGFYGFRRFMNKKDMNGFKLLPDEETYYTVGNLNSEGADTLEYYVRGDYTGDCDKSNMDRIVVSVRGYRFTNVYITQHIKYQRYYNKAATYRISKGLIKQIQEMDRDDFLYETGYLSKQATRQSSEEDTPNSNHDLVMMMFHSEISQQTPPRERQKSCTCSPCVIL